MLCMIAIGDGAKRILAEDIEKLGGANQLTLWTRMSTFKGGRPRRTTERYTFEDAYAIEAECPEVLYVLPNHENYEILVTNQDGNQTRALLEASTADYARGMDWELQAGRFLTENDIETAAQVCVLGSPCCYGFVWRSFSNRSRGKGPVSLANAIYGCVLWG